MAEQDTAAWVECEWCNGTGERLVAGEPIECDECDGDGGYWEGER